MPKLEERIWNARPASAQVGTQKRSTLGTQSAIKPRKKRLRGLACGKTVGELGFCREGQAGEDPVKTRCFGPKSRTHLLPLFAVEIGDE
jgi:hypothetical protein